MKLTGTVASKPTDRVVATGEKKDHPKRIRELAVVDEDGDVVTLQSWTEPDDKSDPFGDLKTGDRITAHVTNPSAYRGITRAALAGTVERL